MRQAPDRLSGRLEHPFSLGFFALIRQKVGAWSFVGIDGDTTDRDGRLDGKTSIEIDRMKPLDDSIPPPRDFEPGDLVFGIDARTLNFYVAQSP